MGKCGRVGGRAGGREGSRIARRMALGFYILSRFWTHFIPFSLGFYYKFMYIDGEVNR